jgi:predicted PolB exonuclease-like 3'-5' exonuclease
MHWMVFDIETVPDTELGRQLLGIDAALSDADVAKAMSFKRLQEAETEFLPPFQHRVVAISVLLRRDRDLHLWSLGDPDSDEAELIQRFFSGIDQNVPELVSWNGSGFDLPVLHYRAMKHRVQASMYWEQGDENRDFRYNNYLNRYHWRHIDVMDVVSAFQPRARARLDDIAVMLGYPGKLGLSGDQVWPRYLDGDIAGIRNYCETDVLNTWLVFLRFQHMRGVLDDAALDAELERTRALLAGSDQPHLTEFLAAWQPAER